MSKTTITHHRFGTGFHDGEDAFEAGRCAVKQALAAGGIDQPNLIFAFCEGAVDHQTFIDGIRSLVGSATPIIGGSAIGIITQDVLCYEGKPCGVAACQFEDGSVEVAFAEGIIDDETAAGRALGDCLASEADHATAMLIFYDSIKAVATPHSPPAIVPSPGLLGGITSNDLRDVPIFGAGLLGDFQFARSAQVFTGNGATSGVIAGLLFKGSIRIDSAIMHGCTPIDGVYHTVTKSDGACIYEVDGRPVVELIDEMYGTGEWREQRPVRRLSLGVNYGEKFGEIHESNFVNRLIGGVLPGDAGIALFEPDLAEGTEFMFMLRDTERIIQSAETNSQALLQQAIDQGRPPLFGLYIDCAGRAASVSDSLTEEAGEVAAAFKRHQVPLLGFYTGVEIAPLLGESRGLDWTGVLMLFTG